MDIDIQKLFTVDFPARLAANPDAARRIGARYQFNITGEGGGQWFVDLSSTGPKVEAGQPGRADCTITISAADFKQLWANPSSGMQLYFSGRLRISGDEMLALRLQNMLATMG
jgi:putative sterol carrier protein